MPPRKNNDQDCKNKSTITGCHLLPPQKLLTFTYYDPRHTYVMSTCFLKNWLFNLEQHAVQNSVPHVCYSIWIRSKERSFCLQTEARQYEASQAPTKSMLKMRPLNNQPKGLSCFRRSPSPDRGKTRSSLCPLSLCGESTEKHCKIHLSSLFLDRRKR